MTTKIDPIQNEIKHSQYCNGFDDGLLYNRGLGHWESFENLGHQTDDYYRGFKDATGKDLRSIFL